MLSCFSNPKLKKTGKPPLDPPRRKTSVETARNRKTSVGVVGNEVLAKEQTVSKTVTYESSSEEEGWGVTASLRTAGDPASHSIGQVQRVRKTSAPEREFRHNNSRQLVLQGSMDSNEKSPSRHQHSRKHEFQRQYSLSSGSPTPSHKAEESFVNKLVHKLLPIADISEDEPVPRKADVSQLSSYSVDYGESSAINSYTMRPRSKTFDPSIADGSLRRHSSVSNCYAIHTNSLNNVGNENSNLQLKNSTEAYKKLSKENGNTRRKYSDGLGLPSLLRQPKSSGECKAVSLTLLKGEECHQSSEGQDRFVKSFGHLEQLKKKLVERGESIGKLDDRSESMKQATEGLSISAHKLAEKYKKKKWYEW